MSQVLDELNWRYDPKILAKTKETDPCKPLNNSRAVPIVSRGHHSLQHKKENNEVQKHAAY